MCCVIVETARAVVEIPELMFLRRGKVRDLFAVDEDSLAMVATDRLSAFDWRPPGCDPAQRGRSGRTLAVLVRPLLRVSSRITSSPPEVADFPAGLRARLSPATQARLAGSWPCSSRRADRVVPFECVVKGYLAGSGWKDYRSTGTVCGLSPPGRGSPRVGATARADLHAGDEGRVGARHQRPRGGSHARGASAGSWPTSLERLSLRALPRWQAAGYAAGRGIIICGHGLSSVACGRPSRSSSTRC